MLNLLPYIFFPKHVPRHYGKQTIFFKAFATSEKKALQTKRVYDTIPFDAFTVTVSKMLLY